MAHNKGSLGWIPYSAFFRHFYIFRLNPHDLSVTPGYDWIARSFMLQQSLPNGFSKSTIHAFAVIEELADIFLDVFLHYEFTPLSFAQISGSCTSTSRAPVPLAIIRGLDTAALS